MQLPLPLPEAVRPWLILNIEFHVIVCHTATCRQALSVGGISHHLYKKHYVKLEYRQQLNEYLK
jgi:hypothetical protein